MITLESVVLCVCSVKGMSCTQTFAKCNKDTPKFDTENKIYKEHT